MCDKWIRFEPEVLKIAKKYGSKVIYLGSGSEGAVWSVDDSYVIKLHNNKLKYSKRYSHYLEPKIYGSGFIKPNMHWVVKELMDTPKIYDFELFDEIILEIYYHVESETKVSRSFKEIGNIAERTCQKFLSKPCISSESLNFIMESYNLSKIWIYELCFEISYKFLTRRDSDLHAGNLGFQKTTRRPIFFDW